ncbi:hypothetical protein BTS2_3290 [Bacillus sp. TS-2]|nr:hypothetical protein BTS2_3290 [Bacillus sp. TS-2]
MSLILYLRSNSGSIYEIFLTNFIISSAEYRYGSYEEEENEILLFQTYKERTAYSNSYEPLILYLNEEREITGYQQRLNEFSRIGSENEVISYLKALEVLLNNQFLKMNDTITNIDYGYYSSIPLENEDLVYAPMWRIEIGENIYLVHAIESDVQQLSSAEEDEELEDIEEIIEGEDE